MSLTIDWYNMSLSLFSRIVFFLSSISLRCYHLFITSVSLATSSSRTLAYISHYTHGFQLVHHILHLVTRYIPYLPVHSQHSILAILLLGIGFSVERGDQDFQRFPFPQNTRYNLFFERNLSIPLRRVLCTTYRYIWGADPNGNEI